MTPRVAVHGGAGRILPEDHEAYERGLIAARDIAYDALENGASALEAAIAAVVSMENDPEAFNAGPGSTLNRDGEIECDAAVMAGWDRSAGAVGAVKRIKNPILAAENVRTESPHVLLVGAHAEAFAHEIVENHLLITPKQRARWQAWRQGQQPKGSATVGAVALDGQGRLAAATSTGGMLGKLPGRVGDSPLIGAGTYANNRVAVSCTGHGEAFVRSVAAKALACLITGQALGEAAKAVLDEVASLGGDGGLIAIDKQGRICVAYNSATMAYAWRTAETFQAQVGSSPGILVL